MVSNFFLYFCLVGLSIPLNTLNHLFSSMRITGVMAILSVPIALMFFTTKGTPSRYFADYICITNYHICISYQKALIFLLLLIFSDILQLFPRNFLCFFLFRGGNSFLCSSCFLLSSYFIKPCGSAICGSFWLVNTAVDIRYSFKVQMYKKYTKYPSLFTICFSPKKRIFALSF